MVLESLNLNTEQVKGFFWWALIMTKYFSKFGPILFFIIQPLLLITVATLSFFGMISGPLALLFFGAVSLEAIYIAFFIRMKLNKTVNFLKLMEEQMREIKAETLDTVRMHRELIYAGHRIKTLQMDLEAVKKGTGVKITATHPRRIHI